ncbi:MAG: flagellar motor switch protein FliM [Candidatus Scalindua rubra]|uniref:Flagellar motor switch protein FliM n=1 Tax=Candidatus Scalindua brodae TaxID=237368 RepID=A0A0B0EQT4_9BACT|nr:MAG: flagellar motor switch [Candidatus Scalindua brodae]MBZ0107221.1 flagellar motor switch protein FliM [Candidatus Scalindua rubra]TWU31660.1 Flagellar motor switch protein FliM [Candidatus Brocadiaceae bacterium S225]
MENTENAILTSEEVESLLESFHESQGITAQPDIIEEVDSKVKYYDFKRPNTISREKKRMLYKVFETTAFQISREVSNFLRGTAKVSLNSIDELSFEIFKNTCPELMFINTIRLKPLQGFGCVAMDMGLCLSIVEKAFGGEGRTQSEIRKLTDTETSIVGNIVKIILGKISDSWKPYDEMEWNISDTAMEPRYLNIASEADVVLLVSFTFNLESSFGEMKFCVPVSSVDKTFDHFFSSKQSNSAEIDNESVESLKKLSGGIKLCVTGVLEETDFTVRDIVNLKTGDVLRLDSKITNNLKVFVEGQNKFYGKLGLFGSKKAIQIVGSSRDDPV